MSKPENLLTEQIIGAGLRVHRELGPGLLETAYHACLSFELADAGLQVESQVPVPLVYRAHVLESAYRIDLLVEKSIVVEVKSVDRLMPVHAAQMISYLKLTGCKVGLLLNFNVKWFIDQGVKRIVHGFLD